MTDASWTRRDWLKTASVGTASAWLANGISQAAEPPARKPRVATINSIYRLRSHAYHIAGRFIYGYTRDGEPHQPPFDLVRMYNHQSPPDDLGPEVCEKHGIQLCRSIAEALGGPDTLDVDAILLICEHGDYPVNDLGQVLYPRFEMFQEIVNVFKMSGKTVPVFVDKHLSFDHRHAATMVRQSQEMGFGLMAGSSLPVVWRRPELDPPLETKFKEGLVAFGFDRAPPEIYFIHALETLQVLMERRAGGETGVRRVTALQGDAVWKAGDNGLWSWDLLEAAIQRNPTRNYGKVREQVKNPMALLIEYADGTRGSVINVVEAVSEFCFGGRITGEPDPVATWFVLPQPPGARFFDALTWNIERFFTAGQPPYPVERTLLTSTILDLGMHAFRDGTPLESPALNIKYTAPKDDGHARGRYIDVPE